MVNYSSAANTGDTTTDTVGTSFTQPNAEWYLLSGVYVYGQYQETVAIFGSSTIDGHASNFGNTNAYPVPNVPVPGQDNDRISDALARTLNAAGFHLGVLNAGILREVAGPTSGSTSASPGVDRIGRDVLHQPGIKTVVIDLGQVDLRNNACGQASDVEASLQNMAAQSYAAGVHVIFGVFERDALPVNPIPHPVEIDSYFACDLLQLWQRQSMGLLLSPRNGDAGREHWRPAI